MHASGYTTARLNSGTGVGLSRPGLRSSPLQLVWWNQTQWWKSDPELPLVPEWAASFENSDRPPAPHCESIGFEVCGTRAAHFRESLQWRTCKQRVAVVAILWSNTRQFLVAHDPARFVTAFRGEARWTEFEDCLASLLHVPTQLPHARTTALMPLSKGGVGFGQCCASQSCRPLCELG